jgi:hypothetical protein
MNQKANYKIIVDAPGFMIILDIGPWDQYLSVTNAAESVVCELNQQLAGRRLEYIDSDGERSELLVRDGKFAGFATVSLLSL